MIQRGDINLNLTFGHCLIEKVIIDTQAIFFMTTNAKRYVSCNGWSFIKPYADPKRSGYGGNKILFQQWLNMLLVLNNLYRMFIESCFIHHICFN